MSTLDFRKRQNPGGRGQGPGLAGPVMDLSNVEPFKCKADLRTQQISKLTQEPYCCNGIHFEPVFLLKVVSELISPTGHRMLAMPAPGENDWRCVKCGKIYSVQEMIGS